MKQQTAVQFLVMRYHQRQGVLKDIDIEIAKSIEKEQIERAYQWDRFPCSDEDAEQYYNETYNK